MPSFSSTLEQAIHAALGACQLNAAMNLPRWSICFWRLLDEPDAARVMQAC